MSDVPFDIEFARLIGRALLLHERTIDGVDVDYLTPFELEKRIEQWRTTLGYVDDVSWQHYLHANGWSQADLPRLAGDPMVRTHDAELPPWIGLLQQVWADVPDSHTINDIQNELPHLTIDEIHLIAPFVTWITQHLEVAPSIMPAARRYLIHQLASMVHDDLDASSEVQQRRNAWSRERWRAHAYHHAWLIRRMSHTCISVCTGLNTALRRIVHDWPTLRQHLPHLPTRPHPELLTVGPAPRAYARYGGLCVQIGDTSLIYVPIVTPAADILEHVKTWLERRGAPVVVHTPTLMHGSDYMWAYVPPARFLTDADEIAQYAYCVGGLAALADILGIIGLDRDALYCAGDTPWLLDYGHIGFAMTHQPPLAHQLIMRAIPVASHAALTTNLGIWHAYEGVGPTLDGWRDNVLAGYQHYYGFVWQRITDVQHMLRSISHLHQRPLLPSVPQLTACMQNLAAYHEVRHGFSAAICMEQLIYQQHLYASASHIRDALTNGVMPHIIQRVSVDGIMSNLTAISALHQSTQLAHLHMALTPFQPSHEYGRTPWHVTTNEMISHEDLIAEALTLADDIVERQLGLDHGSGWLTPIHHPRLTPLHLSDASIDHGGAGIGLVLAKLSSLPNANSLQMAAEAALSTALHHAQHHPYQLGAVCWAIAGAAPHLPVTHQLLPRLNHLLRTPLLNTIDHPQWPDGWAGLIIGLTALHHLWPSAGYGMQALTIGEQLLQSRQRNARGQRTWAGRHVHHGGYGSSGLLIALVRLYEINHDQRFLRAANEIAHNEDLAYDEAHSGWPDTRTTPLTYPVSWGYGSLGVAMGRLSLMAPLRSRHPDHKLLALLAALDNTGLPEADGLAEGSAGVVDVMFSVARALPNPYFEQRAAYWCTQMVTRARDRGGYVCVADIPGIYEHPGVWHGTAGIAYQLARMAYPRLFGSLLAFEMPKGKVAMASDTADPALR